MINESEDQTFYSTLEERNQIYEGLSLLNEVVSSLPVDNFLDGSGLYRDLAARIFRWAYNALKSQFTLGELVAGAVGCAFLPIEQLPLSELLRELEHRGEIISQASLFQVIAHIVQALTEAHRPMPSAMLSLHERADRSLDRMVVLLTETAHRLATIPQVGSAQYYNLLIEHISLDFLCAYSALIDLHPAEILLQFKEVGAQLFTHLETVQRRSEASFLTTFSVLLCSLYLIHRKRVKENIRLPVHEYRLIDLVTLLTKIEADIGLTNHHKPAFHKTRGKKAY